MVVLSIILWTKRFLVACVGGATVAALYMRFHDSAGNSSKISHELSMLSVEFLPLQFDQEMDLRVVRTRTHFELLDVNSFAPRDIKVKVDSNGDAGWGPVQPTNASSIQNSVADSPHLAITNGAIMVMDDILQVDSSTNWILSFVARRLHDSSPFDIVLGPRGKCNCQVRFVSRDSLGIYLTNEGHGLTQPSIPLPMNTHEEYHAVTLMYTQQQKVIKLYQDDQFVTDLDNAESFWGEFARIGSWYQQEFQGSIALRRLFMAKTTQKLPTIQEFLMAREFVQ